MLSKENIPFYHSISEVSQEIVNSGISSNILETTDLNSESIDENFETANSGTINEMPKSQALNNLRYLQRYDFKKRCIGVQKDNENEYILKSDYENVFY